jgi:hypothetical protein
MAKGLCSHKRVILQKESANTIGTGVRIRRSRLIDSTLGTKIALGDG